MRAGTLRQKLVIEENTAALDEYQQRGVFTPAPFATAWGSIEQPTGNEAQAGGQEASTVRSTVHIRYVQGVTPAMRIRVDRFGNDAPRYLEIESVVDPDGRRRELVLGVVERR